MSRMVCGQFRCAVRRRRAIGLALAGVLATILTVASCGGGGRNCLVIPAQIELVAERRAAQIKDLENKANQVDRMQGSLERSRTRLAELQAEKALLDSLSAATR